jgi:aspartokinase
MEKQAKEYILRNINSFINNKTTITNKIKTFTEADEEKLKIELKKARGKDYKSDIDEVVGLGFCVSIDHANFMANYFNEKGIPSVAVSPKSTLGVKYESNF